MTSFQELLCFLEGEHDENMFDRSIDSFERCRSRATALRILQQLS